MTRTIANLKPAVKRTLAVAAVGTAAALVPVGTAQAATTTTTVPGMPFTLTFVPPKVGPITVLIGPVIIGGQVISPGVNISSPGVELPTLTMTWPPG